MTTPNEIYDQATTIINTSAALAREKIDEATGYVESAIDQARSESLQALSILVPAPSLPDIPEVDANEDFEQVYMNRRAEIWAGLDTWIQDSMAGWMDQYAPKLDAQIQPVSDAWLLSVLGEGRLGIPVALEQQIWDRARAREVQEGVALEQTAIESAASRGWSLPSGALAQRLLTVQQDVSMKSATLSRDVMIKQADLTVDISKAGMELAVRLRLGVAQVVGDFFRAALAIPAQASQDASNIIESKTKLWQMLDSYIRGKVAVASIEWQHKAKQADVNLGTSKILSDDKLARSAQIINTAIAGAEAATAVAAAAINSQQSLAEVGYRGLISSEG